MAAKSPRGSLSGASDIASDFEESLKDLQRNDRFAIENLTNIAREHTEHAQAISRVLETHIRTTAPSRKLPALYVLDSIVKNVGTPYTVYLGRGLFTTFMDSYGMINDPVTRRAMDNLLKTWREPVPGSMDHRPVFPLDTVQPITNALIRWKTATHPKQGQVLPQAAYRSTPTPPQFNGQYMAPAMHSQQQAPYSYGSQQMPFQPAFQAPTPLQQQYMAPPTPVQQPYVDIALLKADISSLVSRLHSQFAASPYEPEVQNKLKTVLQLQSMVNGGTLDGPSLQAVRSSVTAFAPGLPHVQAPVPQWQPPAHVPQSYQPPQSMAPYVQPTPVQSQPLPFLAPGALNGLQALLANGQKPSTPQMRTAVPALQDVSHAQLNNVQSSLVAAPMSNTTDLLAALQKSGVFGNIPAPAPKSSAPVPATVPVPHAASTASLLQSLQSILPPSGVQSGFPAPPRSVKPRIPFSSAALKVFRPELVRSLYDDQPNQCNTCARRFLATEDGRAKKTRHYDWHYRTNQRMADPNTGRGQHRNWFMDEREWISLTDFDPSTTTADAAAAVTAAKKEKGPQDQYVRAPSGVTSLTCSICQDPMQSSRSEELEDWVFMNAVKVDGRILHANCAEEIKQSMGQKRKAEAVLTGEVSRVKLG